MANRNYTQKVKTASGYDILYPKTTAEQVLTDTSKRFTSDTEMNGKAAVSHTHSDYVGSSHTHTIANVTNLQTTLDGKAASSHTHDYAVASHTHAIANVTNLQTSLDGKAASSHTHTIANVTNLQTTLDGLRAEIESLKETGTKPDKIWTFPSTSTFIAPVDGTYEITLQDGGNGGVSASDKIGTGGSSGKCTTKLYSLKANTVYTITIGAGGKGGLYNATKGIMANAPTAGGTTSITPASSFTIISTLKTEQGAPIGVSGGTTSTGYGRGGNGPNGTTSSYNLADGGGYQTYYPATDGTAGVCIIRTSR